MFTGIIREVGYIAKRRPEKDGAVRLWLKSKMRPKQGASVAVNGVCLTVTQKTQNGFAADVIPETLERTNLGALNAGSEVNLEPSMRLIDAVDGHLVMGHADTICRVLHRGKIQHGIGLVIDSPKNLAPFVAEKGSVTLNGVSLTVAAVAKNSFTVALIPFTQQHTNLGSLKKGDMVNLEIDILARYAHRNRHFAIQ